MEKSNRTAPLKVVLRNHGYLLFSGSKAGEEALRGYLQRAADRYFEPHAHDGVLEIYEYSGRRRELMPHINGGGHGMSCREGTGKAEYIPREALPAWFVDSLEPRLYHAMNPTADEYRGLFSKVKGYTGFELSSRAENEDIYRLLSIRERGYMNIHDRPFTYCRELLPLAERFEEGTQVKAAELFDPQAFRALSSEIRKKADDILRRDFDVRGHRSLEKYLSNPDTALLVGNVRLENEQFRVLSEGHALYLPENDRPASRHLLYCMADFTRHKLLVSGEPFPVRTYRVKDGIRHPAGQCEELSEKRKRTGQKPSGRKL